MTLWVVGRAGAGAGPGVSQEMFSGRRKGRGVRRVPEGCREDWREDMGVSFSERVMTVEAVFSNRADDC